MNRSRIAPGVAATLAAVVALGLTGCMPDAAPQLPDVPKAGAPTSTASGTKEDPHDPDTTIEGTTLDVVVGPPLAAVDDSAITGLGGNNEAAPEGMVYVVVPLTVTYREQLAPGTTPTFLVSYETEDGEVTATFDDDQPTVWIDDDPITFETDVSGLEVGESLSGHVVFLLDQADIEDDGFIRLGMVYDDAPGYQYVTTPRED